MLTFIVPTWFAYLWAAALAAQFVRELISAWKQVSNEEDEETEKAA